MSKAALREPAGHAAEALSADAAVAARPQTDTPREDLTAGVADRLELSLPGARLRASRSTAAIAAKLPDFVIRRRGLLSLLAGVLILGFTGKALVTAVAAIEAADVLAVLDTTPEASIALAVALTALSFFSLVFYDVAALREIGAKLAFRQIATVSFCAYAVGNTAGLGALTGGAIRYRFYSRLGLSLEDTGRVIAFVAVAFGFGLVCVTAAAVLAMPGGIAASTGIDTLWLRSLAGGVLLLLAAMVVAAGRAGRISVGRFEIALPAPATVVRQCLVTAVDIAASAGVLYVLLPETAISFPQFLGIYAIAIGLGVASHVPAGLGVFETAIVSGLGAGVDLEAVLGALLLYRLIYHGLPLLIAAALMAISEVARLVEQVSALRLLASRDGVAAGACAASALGVGLVSVLELFPGVADTAMALPFSASLSGFALVLAARGLLRRLDGALVLSLTAALAGLLLGVASNGSVFAAGLHLLLIALLWISQQAFTQPALLVRSVGTGPWLGLAATLCLGLAVLAATVLGATDPRPGLWWSFWLSASVPDGAQWIAGLAATVAIVSLAMLLRPSSSALGSPTPEALDLALTIVEAQGAADANLVRMGDKCVLFSEDRQAFIMYAKSGRSWIALFDPVGPRSAWAGLVWQFIDAAKSAGCRAVFYQVSPALLPTCADVGLRVLKLGEQAVVDLKRFELKGGQWASLRRSVNRAARDGLDFSLIPPGEGVLAVMDELKAVSDTWLAHHNVREKRFSLGAFDPAYVAAQPLAIIRLEGRIVAFATLLATPAKESAFIDLMRFTPGAHRGMMDLLFVRIIEGLQAEGFETLNLGMAPLAGMALRRGTPLWNRLGLTIFEFGERLYNFKGLLAFKSKFDPQWQPRYLAVPRGNNPYFALMDIAILIGGGVRGVFRK